MDGDKREERDDEEEMHGDVDEDALRILDQGGEGGRCKSAGSRLEHVINQELSRDISEDREKLITTYFYKEEYLSKQIQIFHVDMHNLSCSHCNI